MRLNKHVKTIRKKWVLALRDRDGGPIPKEIFGGFRGLESDETSFCDETEPWVFTVAKKSDRLHDRKPLSRCKKEKNQSTFSKRVARVALRTCAPHPSGRAAMTAGTKA